MQIKSISIKNFRSIKDQHIECSGYNVFVGSNGAGKSTVLRALNVFFGEQRVFSEADFWNRDTEQTIEIAVVFRGFSDAAKKEFGHYVRNDEMRVVAEVDGKSFKISMTGERLVNPDFAVFFESTNAAEKKQAYQSIRQKLSDLPDETTATACEKALRKYEEAMPEEEKTLVRSGDEFFGATGGKDKIKRFVTWVYVPAVKDAGGEAEETKGSHLGRLIEQTARRTMDYAAELDAIRDQALTQYDELLGEQRQHLVGLETRLRERLQSSVTAKADIELEFRKSDKSVSVLGPAATVQLEDRGFRGDVQSFGHGLQRAFLLVVLQEMLEVESEHAPTLILGCEEPELYQHPPQVRHLASVLQGLGKGGDQVFLTTHSPYFVDIGSLEGLKKVANASDRTTIKTGNFEQLTSKYNEFFQDKQRKLNAVRAKLGIEIQREASEIFFSDFVVLVEGISDRAVIETYLRLSGKNDDLRRLGVNIIQAGGKSSLILLQLMLRQFEIPHFVVFDCDAYDTKHHNDHRADNLTAFALANLQTTEAFPDSDIFGENLVAWQNDIEDALDSDLGEIKQEADEAGRTACGHLKKSNKKPFFIAACMDHAWEAGCRFPTLERLVDRIFSAAGPIDREVIPPFLMGLSRRIHAATFSFIAGVMPPMPMLGRSLL